MNKSAIFSKRSVTTSKITTINPSSNVTSQNITKSIFFSDGKNSHENTEEKEKIFKVFDNIEDISGNISSF